VSIARSQAAAEYLRRQRAQASLVEFSQAIDIPGVPVRDDDMNELFKPIESRVAVHHILTMGAIERTITRGSGRLMVFEPPGCAKSTYASVVAPTWVMGKFPGSRLILGSYATGIAAKQSRKARSICRQEGFTSIWDERPRLLDDQRAVDEWSLNNGSEFMAAGLLAGITGNRANGAIIDDPLANREQADSPTIRAKIHDEYIDTVQTRLLPHGWIILIMTRWHEEDLAGVILPENYNGESGMIKCRDGQTWEILSLQAKCEREDDPLGRKIGEYIWPDWFPVEHWAMWEGNPRAQRTWSALYQQRPAPFTGVHFNRDMFRMYDPDLARV
jgi:hypothetical protein